MKVGDLVRLLPHCRNSERLAIIVEKPDEGYGLHCVKIMFIDNGTRTPATKSNLEIISESR